MAQEPRWCCLLTLQLSVRCTWTFHVVFVGVNVTFRDMQSKFQSCKRASVHTRQLLRKCCGEDLDTGCLEPFLTVNAVPSRANLVSHFFFDEPEGRWIGTSVAGTPAY